MSADTLQALSLSAEGAFSTLVRSTSAQVAELKSLACLRAGAAVGAGDIRALADRASAVEALLTELATHVQEEETAMEELQVGSVPRGDRRRPLTAVRAGVCGTGDCDAGRDSVHAEPPAV